jgi:MoaA/NifB/PqqE/SkfB family radical SAM enzyme
MTFEKTFCTSPWFHMRINNSGSYESCRWQNKTVLTRINSKHNICNQAPLDYFQNTMSELRQQLLDGSAPDMCKDCYTMETHNKVSGRKRQLLKCGIQENMFEKTLAGTPLRADLDHSNQHKGHTARTVSDWQIDLGNYCNSACVFCGPESSSRMATEFVQLGMIDRVPNASWCEDPVLLEKFIKDLEASDHLHYLHFIGGETLITPGFEKILTALIDRDLADHITIGFTTNLTVWSDHIIDRLSRFQNVNLGMSIETMTKLNDYVRWPSRIDTVSALLDRWIKTARQHYWLVQLRITPTCLTLHELHTVYEYAWQHNVSVESCNFIDRPKFMRISVLPPEQRAWARQRLSDWIDQHQTANTEVVVNTRDPNRARDQILQDAKSYLNYLDRAPDESDRLSDLVDYLKRLESGRSNSILTYLSEYETLFRSAGY